jgi:hypothetical protein
MILFHTASSDASIYLQQPYQNTGIDEVLEISKQYYGDTKDISRVLIKFNNTDVSKSIYDGNINKQLLLSSSIYDINTISSSWNNAVSNSLYFSASYTLESHSLFLLGQYSESYEQLSSSYNEISNSIYVLESNITLVNVNDYLAISSSFAAMVTSSIENSIVDLELSSSFINISKSYADYIIESASIFNEKIDYNLFLDRFNNYTTNNITSGSLFTSVNVLSSSWNSYNISAINFSSSYNIQSQSLYSNILNGDYNNNFTASLQLKITEADEIASTFTIELFEVSGSWENGTGTRFDNLTTNGASWYYRNENNSNWYKQMDGITASYGVGVTGSWDGLGGSWFTQSIATQTFSYTLDDINLDVTNAVRNWVSGSSHNGFILKLTSTAESDNSDYGSIKMFSKETNTIYQPKLVLGYADSGSVTGSLAEVSDRVDSANYEFLYRVYPSNLKKEYTKGQKVTIKVDARELYPVKQFNSTFAHQVKYYLPTTTYYSIIDTITKEPIIDYSENTKVVRDNYNNLIKLNFSNWAVGRTYTLLLKVVTTDNEEIFEIGSFDIYE